MRIKDERVPKEAFKGYTEGRRPAGSPRKRRTDAVSRDARIMMKYRNWRGSANDRDVWRRRIEEAKA